jgi:uncharacterized protein (DUF433 family)
MALNVQINMEWHDYIHSNPKILSGKPVVKGTRISVEFILSLLGNGWSEEQIFDNYPGLTEQSLQAIFAYAAENVHDVRILQLY